MWSAAGAFVALAIALSLWRVQLLGKRRMEVAEEILMALHNAIDALSAVRQPLESPGTLAESAKARGFDPHAPPRNERYVVKFNRLVDSRGEFDRLRKAQILSRYFIGEPAAEAVNDFESAWKDVYGALFVLAGQPEPEDNKLLSLRQKALSGLTQPDAIEVRLAKARAKLETACIYHIRMQAAFIPIRIDNSSFWRWIRETWWA